MTTAAAKFDPARASEYETQSRIGLAGYDACHELAACLLSAYLGQGSSRHILVAGAGGTAQEVQCIGRLEPEWRFTAVDPSQPMLDSAVSRLQALGLIERVETLLGYVDDVSAGRRFDGATLIGVLHHLPGDHAKLEILRSIGKHLPSGAPLVLACNRHAYKSRPLLLKAWAERWRMNGASEDEVQAKLGKILQGADPPESEEAVAVLLAKSGFGIPQPFFSSLFWAAWIVEKS
jgi:tRNA (cmo5U34)-methyltransferase